MGNKGLKGVGYLGLGLGIIVVGGQDAAALPTGGTVVEGSAAISTPAAGQMQIDQMTDRAVINWSNFSVLPGTWLNFSQPGQNSAILNRVNSGVPSSIAGKLTANGWVFIVNPDGIGFLNGSQVNVGGLVASTLNISNNNFMNGGGAGSPFIFNRSGHPIASGITVDQGATVATERGAIFVTPGWSNQGQISVDKGYIAVAAGDQVKAELDLFGNGLLTLSVSETVADQISDIHGNFISAHIKNTGVLSTTSEGNIALVAHSNQNPVSSILRNVISLGGTIEAKEATIHNGEVILRGLGNTKVETSPGFTTIKGNNVEISGNGIELSFFAISANKDISFGTENFSIRDVNILEPLPISFKRASFSGGSIQSDGGNIGFVNKNQIELSDVNIDLGQAGNLQIVAETQDDGYNTGVRIDWGSINAFGKNDINIIGVRRVDDISDTGVGVSLSTAINQNEGELNIRGAIKGLDLNQTYDSNSLIGISLGSGQVINQNNGSISLEGEGVNGILVGDGGASINQVSGEILKIDARGNNLLGGLRVQASEGITEWNINTGAGRVIINVSNDNVDGVSANYNRLAIAGNNTEIEINGGKMVGVLEILNQGKPIFINAESIGVGDYDKISYVTTYPTETRIINRNSDVNIRVSDTLQGSTNIATEDGNIFISADKIFEANHDNDPFPSNHSFSLSSSGVNQQVTILTNDLEINTFNSALIQGEGSLQIGTRDERQMNINHTTTLIPSALNISQEELGIIDGFQEITFGSQGLTRDITISKDNSSFTRSENIILENRGDSNNQIKIESAIEAKNLQLATDGVSIQDEGAIINTGRLTLVGSGIHELFTNSNKVNEIQGEAITIDFKNQSELTALDLNVQNVLGLETEDGAINLVGNIVAGSAIDLKGNGGILQEIGSSLTTSNLVLTSKDGSIDLHKGLNGVVALGATAKGGIHIKTQGNTFLFNVSTEDEDIIFRGGRFDLLGQIRAGSSTNKSIIFEAEQEVVQFIHGQIFAKGLGLVTDGISIISGNNSVETIAANTKYLEFKNNKTFEVGTVSASVNAIPSSVIEDTKDFAQVQGILSKDSVVLATEGQILINDSIIADEYVTLSSGGGILQSQVGLLRANGLEIISNAPVDLGQAFNEVKVLSASIASSDRNDGLIIKNKGSIEVGKFYSIGGIVTNGADIIIEADGDINIRDSIEAGNIFLSAKTINQSGDSILRGDGLGVVTSGYADLRNPNELNRLAAQAQEGITITSVTPLLIDKVESKVNKVTDFDTLDERSVEGIEVMNGDVIIRSRNGILVNKAVDVSGNTTLVSNQIEVNESIITNGLGIQGDTNYTSYYQFSVPVKVQNLAVANNDISVLSVGSPNIQDVTSNVNTDSITTNVFMTLPPPVEPPNEPPVVIIPPFLPEPDQPLGVNAPLFLSEINEPLVIIEPLFSLQLDGSLAVPTSVQCSFAIDYLDKDNQNKACRMKLSDSQLFQRHQQSSNNFLMEVVKFFYSVVSTMGNENLSN